MENNEVVLCAAIKRWTGCMFQKNFCCGYCSQLEDCLKRFSKTPLNKIRPCDKELACDCEIKVII